MILAIDCSGPHGLLHLELADGRRLGRILAQAREHADGIIRALAELQAEAGLPWSALERVALTVGPGSFTGLRIGLAAAKGLVFGTPIPLAPLPSLLVPVAAEPGSRKHSVLICRPARGDDSWAALFAPGTTLPRWERLLAPAELAEAALRLRAGEPEALFIGSLPAGASAGFPAGLPAAEAGDEAQLAALGRLARESETLVEGAARDDLLPRYLLEPSVTRPAHPKDAP